MDKKIHPLPEKKQLHFKSRLDHVADLMDDLFELSWAIGVDPLLVIAEVQRRVEAKTFHSFFQKAMQERGYDGGANVRRKLMAEKGGRL